MSTAERIRTSTHVVHYGLEQAFFDTVDDARGFAQRIMEDEKRPAIVAWLSH